jgi:SAM-dependent methyltransferase
MQWPQAKNFEPFDIVVSQEVIEHVPDRMKYLETVFDLLKVNGFLLLTTPNADTFAAMPDELRHSWSDQPFEELLTPRELKEAVRKLFDVVEATTIIPGFGVKGTYRIASSYKLGCALASMRLKRAFDAACLWAGFGLHIFLVAKKLAIRPQHRVLLPLSGSAGGRTQS